jgi:hypothetical protein
VPPVVIGTEPETPDHLKKSQMRAVTNQINVTGANAILDVAKGRAVWMLESGFERLHSRAYKEGGGIVLGNDVD